jgi:hypothetical protein
MLPSNTLIEQHHIQDASLYVGVTRHCKELNGLSDTLKENDKSGTKKVYYVLFQLFSLISCAVHNTGGEVREVELRKYKEKNKAEQARGASHLSSIAEAFTTRIKQHCKTIRAQSRSTTVVPVGRDTINETVECVTRLKDADQRRGAHIITHGLRLAEAMSPAYRTGLEKRSAQYFKAEDRAKIECEARKNFRALLECRNIRKPFLYKVLKKRGVKVTTSMTKDELIDLCLESFLRYEDLMEGLYEMGELRRDHEEELEEDGEGVTSTEAQLQESSN